MALKIFVGMAIVKWMVYYRPWSLVVIETLITPKSSLIIEVTVQELDIDESLNVFGEKLLLCSDDPVTGFFRDGCCNTSKQDLGSHTVCVELTDDFLMFSKSKGNDLTTPVPAYGFPGLKHGDKWCLCAARWLEAFESGCAPRVYLQRTHQKALDIVPLKILQTFAIDLN